MLCLQELSHLWLHHVWQAAPFYGRIGTQWLGKRVSTWTSSSWGPVTNCSPSISFLSTSARNIEHLEIAFSNIESKTTDQFSSARFNNDSASVRSQQRPSYPQSHIRILALLPSEVPIFDLFRGNFMLSYTSHPRRSIQFWYLKNDLKSFWISLTPLTFSFMNESATIPIPTSHKIKYDGSTVVKCMEFIAQRLVCLGWDAVIVIRVLQGRRTFEEQ